MKRWLLITLAMLALTGVLAGRHIYQRVQARTSAGERLVRLDAAVLSELDALLVEWQQSLVAWQPGTPVPSGFASAFRLTPAVPRPILKPLKGHDGTWLGFSDGRLVMATLQGDSLIEGTLAAGELKARLRAHADITGAGLVVAAGPDTGSVRYTTLGIVTDLGVPVWMDVPDPDEDADSGGTDPTKSLLDIGSSRSSYALKQIGRAELPKLTNDDPPGYGGFGGEPVYGLWHRWERVDGLWLLAEVALPDAELSVDGWRATYAGKSYGVLNWWHLGVGLSVLLILITTGSWLREKNSKLGVLMRVFSFVKPYRGGVLLVFLFALLATGVSMTKVFFAKFLFDSVLSAPVAEAEERLLMLGAGMVVLALVMGVTAYFQRYLAGVYQLKIMADVRLALADKLARLPIPYHERFRSGDLLARFEQDAAHLRKIFTQVFRTVAMEPFKLGWASIYAFVINPRLALVLLGLPLVVMPLFRIAKRIKKRAKKRQAQRAEISHVLFQMLSGIKVVKAFGGEARESHRLHVVNQEFVQVSKKITHLSALSEGMLDVMQMLGAAIVMVAGGYLILANEVTTGDLTAFIVVLQQFYSGSKKLTSTANGLVDASAGVERVYEVLDAPNELPDGPDTLPRQPLTQGVRLESVNFAYGEKVVLTDINLDIPAGQVVALVGPTGAGKSTICSLVARFYDPTEGRVTYDGVDLRDVKLSSVVDNLAIVTQDAFLFNETIAENIRYGKPDAKQPEIEQAARDAFVHDEIEGMDEGYRKAAGERGQAVSGGQRQRITIARALLKNAPVLILDEATSALDSHAEQRIQHALDRVMQGRTVLVVAHRLSTIMHADKVVVIDSGRIVEQGPPDELRQLPGSRFGKMYDLQMGKNEDERDTIDDDEAFEA